MEKAVCAIAFPHGVQGGHCHFPDLKVSAVNPDWVWARGGIYNDQNQLRSDEAQIVVDLATRKVVGPTNVGFCGIDDPVATRPIDGYSSVPSDVLHSLGLKPCAPATGTTGSAAFSAFAGTWGAHETSLKITAAGIGRLTYADLARCPTCAQANAPLGTLTFALKSVTHGVGAGSVTASSDAQTASVGDSVSVAVIPGSPGQLLTVTIGGKQLLPFCNASSIGQCGA